MSYYNRGREQLSMLSLPMDGDIIRDTDGVKWTVHMEGGFKLRHDRDPHPAFTGGAMPALEFAEWFNSAFNPCPHCGGGHPVGCCAQDGSGG